MGAQSTAFARRPKTHVAPHAGNHEGARLRLVINDIAYVQAAMECWARWLNGGMYYSSSMTGKLMAGVQGNVCPLWIDDVSNRRAHPSDCHLCQGKGRIKLNETVRRKIIKCSICDPDGNFMGQRCFRCGGRKRYIDSVRLVNPAIIRGGSAMYGDVQSSIINTLVRSWTESDATIWWHRVSVFHYCRNGTQEMKAKTLKISLRFFERRLHEAHFHVEQELNEKLPKAS
jgi:hypothetical protein